MVGTFIAAKGPRDCRAEWIQGTCNFLRLPVLDAAGQPQAADKRYPQYRAAWRPGASSYDDYAGRLIHWSERRGLNVRRPDQLPQIAQALWETDLTAELGRPLR
jgi:hypothetical protein